MSGKIKIFEDFIKLFDEEEFLKNKQTKIDKQMRIFNTKLKIIESEKSLKELKKKVEKAKSEK